MAGVVAERERAAVVLADAALRAEDEDLGPAQRVRLPAHADVQRPAEEIAARALEEIGGLERKRPGGTRLGGFDGFENRQVGFAGAQCVGGQRGHRSHYKLPRCMRWPARWRRPLPILRDLAVVAVLGYAAAISYLYAYQVDIVFRPPPRGSLTIVSLGLAPERVALANADGLATEAWKIRAGLATPEPGRAVAAAASPYWVLYLHGNAATISTSVNQRRYDQLRGLGLNLLAVEYPGFGEVGGVASEAGMHAAARAGYDHLRQVEGVAAANVAIYGWSLGTGAAIPLARDVDEAALVVEGGFTSVLDRGREAHPLMPVRLLLAHPFRSDQAIGQTRSPTLFLHSRPDAIVPYHHGEALFALAAAPKRFVTLAGGHIYHNAVDADRYTGGIYDFLAGVVGWRVTAAAAVRRRRRRQGARERRDRRRSGDVARRGRRGRGPLEPRRVRAAARGARLHPRRAPRRRHRAVPRQPRPLPRLAAGLVRAGPRPRRRRRFGRRTTGLHAIAGARAGGHQPEPRGAGGAALAPGLGGGSRRTRGRRV